MQTATILALNQLNLRFYQMIANSFARTRKHPWEGWSSLLPFLPTNSSSILDVGCGTGRFYDFLRHHQVKTKYVGVDSSQLLLNTFEQKSAASFDQPVLHQLDLVDMLLRNQLLTFFSDKTFDLITLFGVFHHIPSKQLRQRMLHQLGLLLEPGGQLVVTCWQCDMKRFKTIDPQVVLEQVSEIVFDPTDLEPNDLFLGWQNRVGIYRYAHWVSPAQFGAYVPSSLEVTSTFRADGKSHNVNAYFILQKPVE